MKNYNELTEDEKTQELSIKGNLTIEETDELAELLSAVKEPECRGLFVFMCANTDWIRKIVHNYQAKKRALATADANLWEKILADEERQLQDN